jgi:5-deoxy-glucuronate isomerase
MSLLVKAQRGRTIVNVTPQSANWRYVGFAAYRLEAGEVLELDMPERESCAVVLEGIASIECEGESWREIGQRRSVFDDIPPFAVYLPNPAPIRIKAHTNVEIGIGSAPAGALAPPRLIEPQTMNRTTRGQGTNTRYVCEILPESAPAAHLLVVEVRTPSSHSSSYPPHKHDAQDLPNESALEETYYHRLDPPQGFAFQRVYTDDRSLDESLAVENRDVVLVPRGYHPVVVPHGYESYYLNVMAGPLRTWHFRNDPAHEWMLKR